MNYQELLEKLKTDLVIPHAAIWDNITFWVVLGVVLLLVIIAFWVWFGPIYNVWAAHKEGLADLARAQNEQQCQVAVAKGRYEAAELNKKAAIIEAEAVASQIEKIGENLQKHDLYLKWQWIKMMEDHSDQATIYIPTEAGLPILEANRRNNEIKIGEE